MTSRVLFAVPLVAALAAPLAVGAAEKQVRKGPQVSAPVKPVVLDVDLRSLPLAKAWEPGDGIKEIPRRHSRPIPPDPPAGRGRDPLLGLSEAAPPRSDLGFPSPILNFDAQNFTGVNPPDTVGDVGPNHYIQMINHSSGSSFVVYDKAGSVIAGPTILDTLGAPAPCNDGGGDPVVLYDPLADRWLLSEFTDFSSGNNLCVYVSQTPDPLSGGWFLYRFETPDFPDYPKYAVWPDAYYVGTNENSPAVYALDRTRMLAGLTATMQRLVAPVLAGFPFQMLVPADLDGPTPPPAGAPAVFLRHRDDEVHNAPGNPTQDFVDLFEFHVDWAVPGNSTFTGPISVPVAEFSSELCGFEDFFCFPQQGSGVRLDPLREVFLFRVQYRNYGSHQAIAGNFVVDADGEPDTPPDNERGGTRWVELRKTTGPWFLQQEGTHSPDTDNRWMAGVSMDGSGNLALAYNMTSGTMFPSIRYAGRLAGDPPGTLQAESTIVAGSAANASIRYGDYSAMGVDPSDDCTFWFTGMYNPLSQWRTRIASFKFDACGGPGFIVSPSPAVLTINRGGSANSTITLTSTGGFAGSVDLTASGQPAGVTVSFSPSTVVLTDGGFATSTATFLVGAATPTGSTPVSIVGTSGATMRQGTVSLTVNAGGGNQTAVFDAGLQAPKCTIVGNRCDSGPTLLLGRDGVGPEPNQPNTINDSCPDGTSGAFHVDESIDRIRVTSNDFTNFAPGKQVTLSIELWAWTTVGADKVDIFYAANANDPDWIYYQTVTPPPGAVKIVIPYFLPIGNLQAVRARIRYHGRQGPCGRGPYDDVDDLVFAVDSGVLPPDNNAVFDGGFQAPRCATAGRSCDSGPTLLLGRDGRGPEPNQPNTLGGSCADGQSGVFHLDESNDRLRVDSSDGLVMAAGQAVLVEATVWASREFMSDRLDLYSAANAASPVWTLITTLTPGGPGAQTLRASLSLPVGAVQAVRARFRYGGSQAACGTGAFDDTDDLVFAVP